MGPAEEKPTHPRLVLVVDDDPTTAGLVADVLRDEPGLTARAAHSAEEAMEAVADQRPDLILIDLAMPGTNGFQLARRLSADPAMASTRLVAMSALMHVEQEALAAGCAFMLAKPFDVEQLLAAVQRALGHSRAPARVGPPVLVVEDDPGVRDVLVGLLEDEGYTTVSTPSIEGAIEVLRSQSIGTVVTDCVWAPSGPANLGPLRRLMEAAPSVPIVLSSTRVAPESVDTSRHGLFAVVSKPFDFSELLGVLERARARVASGTPLPGRQRTVLLVEDSQEIGTLVRTLLDEEGWGVVWHRRGLAALLAAREVAPDVVVLDLGLPDSEGAALLGALTDDPVLGGTPVVVVSANTMRLTERERGLAAAVVSKPFEVDELLRAIEAAARPAGVSE